MYTHIHAHTYRDRIGLNKRDPLHTNIVDNRYNTGALLCCILWCIFAAIEVMFTALTDGMCLCV